MLFRGSVAKSINEGLWPIKIIAIIALFITMFFVTNDFFVWYLGFAKIFGALFLFFQSVMIIDVKIR